MPLKPPAAPALATAPFALKLSALSAVAASALAGGAAAAPPEFHPPVRLKAGDELIRVEKPGYAAPCVADIDRDGKPDLLVGQFKDGKIRVFKGLGDGKFAAGEWLMTGKAVALVPGVW
ncbi:MAG: FG-GAP repeat protein [Phycisphaerales bacterium]|nr:FG-GAP repeat protein [Phycisphaerales bacterium]